MLLDIQSILGLLAVAYMAVRSYRRQSLTPAGCLAAALVGLVHALHPHRPLLLLLVFFIAGTKLTSWGQDMKQELLMEPAGPAATASSASVAKPVKQQRGRTATQVFCNSGPATVLLLLHQLYTAWYAVSPAPISLSAAVPDLLMVGVVAQYACSAGDTFASEIGVLNDDWPLLITTLQKVPPGTNGGVSLLGQLAALMGGGFIGFTAMFLPAHSLLTRMGLFSLGVACGFFGSLADSILGATMQRTLYDQEMKKVLEAHGGNSIQLDTQPAKQEGKEKWIIIGRDLLDNNQVNLASALLTIVGAMTTVAVAATLTKRITQVA